MQEEEDMITTSNGKNDRYKAMLCRGVAHLDIDFNGVREGRSSWSKVPHAPGVLWGVK